MGGNIGAQPRNLSIKLTVEGPMWAFATLDSIGIFTTAAAISTPSPTATALQTDNDFRPSVNLFRSRSGPMKFHYSLSQPDTVSIVVYTLNGRQVRTLMDGPVYSSGWFEAVWDGNNEAGDAVANGVYIVWLQSSSFSKKVRVAVVK
jgi:flagellar hook assembly protein FlgD